MLPAARPGSLAALGRYYAAGAAAAAPPGAAGATGTGGTGTTGNLPGPKLPPGSGAGKGSTAAGGGGTSGAGGAGAAGAGGQGTYNAPKWQDWMGDYTSPDRLGPWYQEFQKVHGMTPEQYYMQPGQTYTGGPGYSAGYALEAALNDLSWAEGFARQAGRPPNQVEWDEHWYNTHGGWAQEKKERPEPQASGWTPPPLPKR